MTYKQALKAIDLRKPVGMKWGLERMERILSLLDHPERTFRSIHVAGTNGKGSTARMIQCILTAAGYHTGLYSSPAVTGPRDTITIDGISIPEEVFAATAGRLLSLQQKMGEAGILSEFEFMTAMAFLYFSEQNTDIAVIECGLGGRDDATNCIPAPLAAVLTPISLDHTAVLGSTIEEIAAHKCGIIKPSCAVVTSPDQNEDALAVILEASSRLGLTVRIPAAGGVSISSLELGRTGFVYDSMAISLPLTGAFQRGNALTAMEAVRAIAMQGFRVTNEHIVAGLQSASMPCRQEVLRRDPLVMLDGAHNPQGVAALAQTLRQNNITGLTLITGMLADKDVVACMRLLLPFCRRIICCTPGNARALPAAALAQIVGDIAPELPVTAVDNPVDALSLADRDKHAPLLVAGSFYVAGVLRGFI